MIPKSDHGDEAYKQTPFEYDLLKTGQGETVLAGVGQNKGKSTMAHVQQHGFNFQNSTYQDTMDLYSLESGTFVLPFISIRIARSSSI